MTISIRLPDDKYEYLQKQSHISGIPLSTYCRNILLGKEVKDTLPRQMIGKTMCIYHNRIADTKTIHDAKKETHKMEEEIWRLIG